MTALNQVMRDIEQHYPNLFDLNTAQGREFVSRFHKYLEIEKEQIKDAWLSAWKDSMIQPLEDKYYMIEAEQYYNETFSNKGD
jgi:hypothetical protein